MADATGEAIVADATGADAPTPARRLAAWAHAVRFEDLPPALVAATKLHIIDSIGLILVTNTLPYGRITHEAVASLGGGAEARILGSGTRTSALLAMLANGAMADALDYDDTHNETHLHPGAHVVPASLGVGELTDASGRDLLLSVVIGNEIGCRIALGAPGQFNRNGFHTSAMVGAFSTTLVAARALGLSLDQMVCGMGLAGSMAAGILECYTDGTWTQGLHPGWIAHGGLTAAQFARAGFTGPPTVLEGRLGFFRAHVQDPAYRIDWDRMTRDLGRHWEALLLTLKPYPTGCVIHPYLDAILHLHRAGLRADQVASVTLPMSPHWVGLVCEPVAEKLDPKTETAARISLQYAVAEALHTGGLGLDSFSHATMADPAIRALASRMRYVVDENPPPRHRFRGGVIVETTDGRRLERHEDPWDRGAHTNPDTPRMVRDKFRENAGRLLPPAKVEAILDAVDGLDRGTGVRALVDLCRIG